MIYGFPLQAVRHGGRKEYEAVQKVHDKPKTPTSRISAMHVPSGLRLCAWCMKLTSLYQIGDGCNRGHGAPERDVPVYP